MGRIAYKKYIEHQLGVTFKPSKQEGFQYIALDSDGQHFNGTEIEAQRDAALFLVVRSDNLHFVLQVWSPYAYMSREGMGYRALYDTLVMNKIIQPHTHILWSQASEHNKP